MKVFATRSTEHLLHGMNVEKGKVTCKEFSDGEIYVKIEEEVHDQTVWVLAATPAPAENILELLFMLDALERAGAKIHLLMTYFGYARQDRAESGEALSAAVLFYALRKFTLESTAIIHIHNARLRTVFDFEDVIFLDFFIPRIDAADIIVAPDTGVQALVAFLGTQTKKPTLMMHKTRPAQEEITYQKITHNVKQKKVLLIDDMIVTGNTILNAAHILKEHGAAHIQVAATHGLFTDKSDALLNDPAVDVIFVTNTLQQNIKSTKVEVIDCCAMLENIIVSSRSNTKI